MDKNGRLNKQFVGSFPIAELIITLLNMAWQPKASIPTRIATAASLLRDAAKGIARAANAFTQEGMRAYADSLLAEDTGKAESKDANLETLIADAARAYCGEENSGDLLKFVFAESVPERAVPRFILSTLAMHYTPGISREVQFDICQRKLLQASADIVRACKAIETFSR
jgi:hypothetical protein